MEPPSRKRCSALPTYLGLQPWEILTAMESKTWRCLGRLHDINSKNKMRNPAI